MTNFAIIRIQKLKAAVAVRRSLKHAFRSQETPNADPAKLSHNTNDGASSVEEAMTRFQARLPEKIRKNAVLAVEFLVTASPEAMAKMSRVSQDRYFADALAWLRERHGIENVVFAGIHRDESTPHLYAYVVPLDNRGKLNCRAFYGGADALRNMQSEFADGVGRCHGLDRGIEGSKARHTTVLEFYAGIQQAEKPMRSLSPKALEPRVTELGSFLKKPVTESAEQVAERVTRGVHAEFKPLAAAAGVVAVERKRRKTAEAAAKAKAAELEALRPLVEALRGLPPDELVLLVDKIDGMKRAAQMAAVAAKRAAQLVKYARQATSSALSRWARWAVDAMNRVGGDHRSVSWDEAENGWADAASAGRDGSALSRETIMRTLADHSPGRTYFDTRGATDEEVEIEECALRP